MDIRRYYAPVNEGPLDHMEEAGLCGILRTVACVGDSLSSGELESKNEEGNRGFHDYFDISWGQFYARMTGCLVRNFSKGGMTAQNYVSSFAEKQGFWAPELACQAYMIALGVNDIVNLHQEVGTTDDIDLSDWHNNKPTFAGYMGQIMSRYLEIQPKARFFLITMPKTGMDQPSAAAHRELMYALAKLYPFTYVIDLYRYGPVYDAEYRRHFMLGGHLNSAGYLLTAKMLASYVDYIIRQNYEDFIQIGFVGTEFHNVEAKW